MSFNEQWIAFMTIVRKEVRRFLRIWMQTLLPPAITMTLYFVIFGTLIGSRIGEMGGFNYIQFVVPGLVMMAVVTNSYANVVSSFFGAKFQRFIEEILVSPMSNSIILWGYVIGGVSRGLLVGFIVTLLSLFFTELHIHNIWITIAIVALTSVFFSLAGFVNAVFANNFDDVSIVPVFVLTPLTYLGGVFYSVDMLSDFWANVSHLNPMLYIVNAFRFGILGVSDVNVVWAFVMVLCFTVAAYLYCMHLLANSKRLRQ
ncbi:MAG TPA: ABC transporter permease, partial [Spongiibacteraceae bacterium]|nr:ABC transporter permease [Spongiibacteraceae bacterium]HCS25862.1 ABC transporter permease [Spongiibacteraceae bacterium]|tara:strand:- start:1510 stop:2283 length:774 start_codon:yes stop_codon:yes gene_type:complete